MGPLYHLNDMENRKKCYEVLKKISTPNVIFIFTYLTPKEPFSAVLKGKIKMSDFWNLQQAETVYKGAFYFTAPSFMEKEIAENSFQILEHLTTDPICCFYNTEIDTLSDGNYQDFLKTIMCNNADPCLLNLSAHNMIVAKIKKSLNL